MTIRVTAADPEPEDGYAPSGVQSITMPDGTVVEGDAADFTVSANGTYDFIITDNGGNTATLHAEVGNVDTARPTVDFHFVPFPVSWTVKMKKKQKETQDILSYHTQAAGCSDKARAKASGGRQPIEECGRTGL